MPTKKVRLGERFGKLQVIAEQSMVEMPNGDLCPKALCRCDCGKQKLVNIYHLLSERSTSCGCACKKSIHGHAKRNAISPTYWSWSAMMGRCYRKSHSKYKNYGARGIRVCERWKRLENLIADIGERPDGCTLGRENNDGHYSCGACDNCLKNGWPRNVQWATAREQNDEVVKRLTAHAIRKAKANPKALPAPPKRPEVPTETSDVFWIWKNMLRRCNETTNPAYPRYGGRGITVCDEWRVFKTFVDDMGPRPKGWTLERKDNNKGYCNENCVWATRQEQNQNKRNVTVYTIRGVTGSLQFLCAHFGAPYNRTHYRVRYRHWEPELAIFTPHIFKK